MKYSAGRSALYVSIGLIALFLDLDKYDKDFSYIAGTGNLFLSIERLPAIIATKIISKRNWMGHLANS